MDQQTKDAIGERIHQNRHRDNYLQVRATCTPMASLTSTAKKRGIPLGPTVEFSDGSFDCVRCPVTYKDWRDVVEESVDR